VSAHDGLQDGTLGAMLLFSGGVETAELRPVRIRDGRPFCRDHKSRPPSELPCRSRDGSSSRHMRLRVFFDMLVILSPIDRGGAQTDS
jgi:hypothetical protein